MLDQGGDEDRSAGEVISNDPAFHVPLTQPLDLRVIALWLLCGLAVIHTLRMAPEVFLPIVLAILAQFVLGPVVRFMRRRGIPAVASATVIVSLGIGTVAGAVGLLSEPASEWFERAPATLRVVENRLRFIQRPVERMVEVSEGVEELASLDTRDRVVVESEGVLSTLASQTGSALVGIVATFAVLFLALASGDALIHKVVTTMPRAADRERAHVLLEQIQRGISRHLLTISGINLALGVVVAVTMWMLDVPSPILWGVLAGLLNFVPFIGPALMTLILLGVSLISFEDPLVWLVPPAVFVVLTAIEGLVVTPAILGARLTLSPMAVFLSILGWSWLWGIPGGLIAVPMLAAIKIVCDSVAPLRRIGFLLGGEIEYPFDVLAEAEAGGEPRPS